jgi:hypothetical protein
MDDNTMKVRGRNPTGHTRAPGGPITKARRGKVRGGERTGAGRAARLGRRAAQERKA